MAQLVELVLERTAGLPVLVDRLLDALVELAGPDRGPDPAAATGRPPGLLAQLGYTVAAQEPGVRGLLLARALGAAGRGRGAGAAARRWPARPSWTSWWRRPAPPACSPPTGWPSR